jgi:DNA processing protein
MDDKDLIDRLRLIRTSHIGPVTCQLLLRRYNKPKAALQAIPELSARGGRRLKACTIEVAEKELSQIRKSGAELICHGQEHCPASLYPYDDAPLLVRVMLLLMLPILPKNWLGKLASKGLLSPLG